ncbi:MAG: S9 family peptidase [Planctomycetota bacterium]|nr:S9 family peptidase [Planctomycetota bacterium]
MNHSHAIVAFVIAMAGSLPAVAARPLELIDAFALEYASNPQISPDGKQVVYTRNSMDIMTDRVRGRLWTIDTGGKNHRPLLDDSIKASGATWSPDGKRLAYSVSGETGNELVVRWVDSGQTARVAQLDRSPGNLTWSPDGRSLAFTLFISTKRKPFASLPKPPKGAKWAKPARVFDQVRYRADGRGYLEPGFTHIFVVPAEGGAPRQLTSGNYNHSGRLSWTADSGQIIFSATRRPDWQLQTRRSDLHSVAVADGTITTLTDRKGPDHSPTVSPDGKWVAYLGYQDVGKSYQADELTLQRLDKANTPPRVLAATLDRTPGMSIWAADSSGLFFQYDDQGITRVGVVSLKKPETVVAVATNVGGTVIGRPYAGGTFSVSNGGTLAYTQTRPEYPADVAITPQGKPSRRITGLNHDLLSQRQLAHTEAIRYKSSFDGREMHGWVVTPPGFDARARNKDSKPLPVMLEIHGGPFANYGERFSFEIQLYAAAGYIVLYTNPRGSTGYGREFTDLIDHNYPSEGDFQDMMSGLDVLIDRGWADRNRQYITGGSGGGILTAWVVGKTGRFKAAVAQKPVINWHSFIGVTDAYPGISRYWFHHMPWEEPERYLARSPISLVGKVTTPTMLLTGEDDHRTPISESEQFYQALKLRGVDTMMVRVPGASHGIVARPSRLMVKVAHVLKWFQVHR